MKPKILVVEDEPAIIDTIVYALETEGCETVSRLSGGPVMDLLAREPVDLIILDIGLPDISGLELFKQIRGKWDLPVIFLTARSSEIDRVLGLELGGDDYMVKPFSPRELVARVRAVLRRTRSRVPESEAGTSPSVWQVDADRRHITYYGVHLDLSRYEYNLLTVLLRKPGQVFTRDQLMDQAWNEPEASMDRTVDTHIKTLRAKLRIVQPACNPIITHRGIGYSLEEWT